MFNRASSACTTAVYAAAPFSSALAINITQLCSLRKPTQAETFTNYYSPDDGSAAAFAFELLVSAVVVMVSLSAIATVGGQVAVDGAISSDASF